MNDVNKALLFEAFKQKRFLFFVLGSDEQKNDKEIVLAAVKENGLILQYASEALKNDKEVVLEAIKENPLALEHVGEELKNNKEFLYEIKEILELRKEEFVNEYTLLKQYEREDEIVSNLKDTSNHSSPNKKKI